MKYQKRIINNIQLSLGNVCLMIFSSTLFLLYGTLISFITDFSIDSFHRYHDFDITTQLLCSLAIIILFVFLVIIVVFFVNLTALLAKKHFLPHILNNTSNKKSIIVGIPILLILSFIQQFCYQYNSFLLFQTIILCIIIIISILLLYTLVKLSNYTRKQINKTRYFLFRVLLILLLFVEFATIFLIGYFSFEDFTMDLLIAIVAIIITFVCTISIHTYYDYISRKLAIKNENVYLAYPTKITAFIVASKLNKPTIRAISFSKSLHNNVEILCIANRENNYGGEMYNAWKKSNLPIPLRIYTSNNNNIAESIYDFISNISLKTKRELIAIYIPHFSSENVIERFLHNQTAKKIERHLQSLPNVIISNIPWQRKPTIKQNLNYEK